MKNLHTLYLGNVTVILIKHHVVCIILIHSNISQVDISDILRVQRESTQTVTSVRRELHTYTKVPSSALH